MRGLAAGRSRTMPIVSSRFPLLPYLFATLLALLALSDAGAPSYHAENASALASMGIPAFACTPDLFPDLMAAAIQRHDIRQWAAQNDLVANRLLDDDTTGQSGRQAAGQRRGSESGSSVRVILLQLRLERTGARRDPDVWAGAVREANHCKSCFALERRGRWENNRGVGRQAAIVWSALGRQRPLGVSVISRPSGSLPAVHSHFSGIGGHGFSSYR